jgi:hypothetical protein
MFPLADAISDSNGPGWENAFDVDVNPNEFCRIVQAALQQGGYASFVEKDREAIAYRSHFRSDEVAHRELSVHLLGYDSLPASMITCVILTERTVPLLCQPASFFRWKPPDYPEDLALYDDQKKPWLYTISHEWMMYFKPERVPQEALVAIRAALARAPGYLTEEEINAQIGWQMEQAKILFAEHEAAQKNHPTGVANPGA